MFLLQSKDGGEISLALDKLRLNIGRDAGNDLVLDDPAVSGFHAGIFFDNGRVELVDLGSTNGTFINGRKLSGRAELKAWDLVRFGSTELEIADSDGRRPTSVMKAVSVEVPGSAAVDPVRPLAKLEAVSLHAGPAIFEIRDSISIGRSPGNNLLLKPSTVSSTHAEIRVVGGMLELIDQGSTNGTFVNGRRIDRQVLKNGDCLRFDEVEYRIEIPRSAADKTTVNPAASPPSSATSINPVPAAVKITVPADSGDVVTRVEPVAGSGRPGAESFATKVEKSPVAPLPPPLPAPPVSPPKNHHQPSFNAVPNHISKAEKKQDLAWLLLSFSGRIGRVKYLLAAISLGLVSCLINMGFQVVAFGHVVSFNIYDPNYLKAAFFSLFVTLLFMWPTLALATKRLHDQDRSGHWNWLLLIPLVGGLAWMIMVLFLPGTPTVNRFGSPPD